MASNSQTPTTGQPPGFFSNSPKQFGDLGSVPNLQKTNDSTLVKSSFLGGWFKPRASTTPKLPDLIRRLLDGAGTNLRIAYNSAGDMVERSEKYVTALKLLQKVQGLSQENLSPEDQARVQQAQHLLRAMQSEINQYVEKMPFSEARIMAKTKLDFNTLKPIDIGGVLRAIDLGRIPSPVAAAVNQAAVTPTPPSATPTV